MGFTKSKFYYWAAIWLYSLSVCSFSSAKDAAGPVAKNEVVVDVEETPEEAGSEYSLKKNKIGQVKNEIQAYQDELTTLTKSMGGAGSTEGSEDVLTQLVDINKNIKEKTVELRELEMELKYKYPEKNQVGEKRKYVPVRLEQSEEVDLHDDIEVVLTSFRILVGKKYKSFMSKEELDNQEQTNYFRKISSVEDEKKAQKKRIRLVQ